MRFNRSPAGAARYVCAFLTAGFSFMSFAAGSPEEQAVLTLKVVDPWGNPVPCEVQRIAPNSSSPEVLGHTDSEHPSLTISEGCTRGCKLLFYPDAASVYYAGRAYCPYTKETFTVRPIQGKAAKELANNLNASKDGSAASSVITAFAANEIADRTESKAIKEAYDFQSYIQAAKFFGVSTAVIYDFKQKAIVPSAELDQKIAEFQKAQGLKETGNLDYRTFERASGKTANDLLGGG